MKIVIAGNYGAKNLGDEMILEGLIETLKKNRLCPPGTSDAEITVLSANPAETKAKYSKYKINSLPKFPAGIRSFLKNLLSSKNQTKKAVQDCDYFILGGGGLFGSLSYKANLIWAIQAKMAYKLKKPVVMLGQSIGPIKWPSIRHLVKNIFQKAQSISVRDQNSREILKELGVTKEITVAPDLAFSIPFSPTKTPHDLNKKTAIISLRQIRNLPLNFQKNISDFLNWLINKQNYQLKFINFQEGPEGDGHLHQKMITLIKDKSKVEHVEQKDVKSTNDLLKMFQSADFILGMRLHSIIAAIKTKTPFVAISYAPKVENLLNDANLSQFIIQLKEINSEKLQALFKLNF